jgi:D-alanyl-D-alanine carboxypeptidase
MICDRNRVGRALCRVIIGLSAILTVTALTGDAADARRRHHHSRTETSHHRHDPSEPSRSEPRYADIVVDANSGNVLHESNPDSLRHPASLTKIMTLYLLFEQLEAGRIKLTTPLRVSAHAANQAPTKLGLKAGQSIEVEDAIKAIVTESANDMAVVVAEAIGGDEDTFARLMTRKANALGMTRTVYVNASGLPAGEQLTTARDQALLGRAIQERFPTYYRYFATTTFRYHGRAMRNHNHLLGNVAGVDGIKTGYTQASGFNLVTSVRRGNRHIVAAVMGGASGGARDARMRSLIEQHVAEASTRRTVTAVAETGEASLARAKMRSASAEPTRRGSAETTRAAAPDPVMRSLKVDTTAAAAPRPGSAEPIQPIVVKTINVRSHAVETAALAPLVTATPQSTVAPKWAAHAVQPAAASPAPAPTSPQLAFAEPPPLPPPAPRPGLLGTLPVRSAALAPPPEAVPALPPPTRPAAAASLVTRAAIAPVESETDAAAAEPPLAPARSGHARGDWTIQLGAFPEEGQARERLKEAQSMAQNLLHRAEGYTEKVVKGSKELYRARFAGLDKDGAEAACHYFKRNDIACMALKN